MNLRNKREETEPRKVHLCHGPQEKEVGITQETNRQKQQAPKILSSVYHYRYYYYDLRHYLLAIITKPWDFGTQCWGTALDGSLPFLEVFWEEALTGFSSAIFSRMFEQQTGLKYKVPTPHPLLPHRGRSRFISRPVKERHHHSPRQSRVRFTSSPLKLGVF